MSIKDIKKYADFREKGEATLGDRMDMLIKHEQSVKDKIMGLETNLEKLQSKIEYYRKEIQLRDEGE